MSSLISLNKPITFVKEWLVLEMQLLETNYLNHRDFYFVVVLCAYSYYWKSFLLLEKFLVCFQLQPPHNFKPALGGLRRISLKFFVAFLLFHLYILELHAEVTNWCKKLSWDSYLKIQITFLVLKISLK